MLQSLRARLGALAASKLRMPLAASKKGVKDKGGWRLSPRQVGACLRPLGE